MDIFSTNHQKYLLHLEEEFYDEIDQTEKFSSIQEAGLPCKNSGFRKRAYLFLHSGIYRGTDYRAHTIYSSRKRTVHCNHRLPSPHARLTGGRAARTFRTFTCFIGTHDYRARSITFENNAGEGTGRTGPWHSMRMGTASSSTPAVSLKQDTSLYRASRRGGE